MNKQQWVGTWPISRDKQQMIKVTAMWNLRAVTGGSWATLHLQKEKDKA